MADVSNELIYEIVKQIQSDTTRLEHGQSELKAEIAAATAIAHGKNLPTSKPLGCDERTIIRRGMIRAR